MLPVFKGNFLYNQIRYSCFFIIQTCYFKSSFKSPNQGISCFCYSREIFYTIKQGICVILSPLSSHQVKVFHMLLILYKVFQGFFMNCHTIRQGFFSILTVERPDKIFNIFFQGSQKCYFNMLSLLLSQTSKVFQVFFQVTQTKSFKSIR
jgi:hypothetical protein